MDRRWAAACVQRAGRGILCRHAHSLFIIGKVRAGWANVAYPAMMVRRVRKGGKKAPERDEMRQLTVSLAWVACVRF